MPQALLIVGATLVLVGLGGIVAGAPDWVLGLSLGDTLIQSGTIAFVGGTVVMALALVLGTLQRLLRRLESPAFTQSGRPAQTARTAEARNSSAMSAPAGPEPEPEPHADAAPDRNNEALPEFSADDLFRSRREQGSKSAEKPARPRREGSTLFVSDQQRPARRESQDLAGEGSARIRRDRFPDFSGEETARPRDLSSSARREEVPRARRELAPPSPPPPLPPLPMLPDERRRPRYPSDAAAASEPPLPRFRPSAPSSAAAQPDTTVLRSGVIGGMAYTLYADGSIEAELPIGTVRFGSIAELQDHVLRTGAEADVDFKESAR
jgi:hypothetical protein